MGFREGTPKVVVHTERNPCRTEPVEMPVRGDSIRILRGEAELSSSDLLTD